MDTVGLEMATQNTAYVAASAKQANALLQGLTTVMGAINNNFTQYFLVGGLKTVASTAIKAGVTPLVDKAMDKMNAKAERMAALENNEQLVSAKNNLESKITDFKAGDAKALASVTKSLEEFSGLVETSGNPAMLALAACRQHLYQSFNGGDNKPTAPTASGATGSVAVTKRTGQVATNSKMELLKCQETGQFLK